MNQATTKQLGATTGGLPSGEFSRFLYDFLATRMCARRARGHPQFEREERGKSANIAHKKRRSTPLIVLCVCVCHEARETSSVTRRDARKLKFKIKPLASVRAICWSLAAFAYIVSVCVFDISTEGVLHVCVCVGGCVCAPYMFM